jgi:hypothetical protein
MPIVRLNEAGKVMPELRRWGFSLTVDRKTIDQATDKWHRINQGLK